MFESFEKALESTKGTVEEMELRYVFAAIRKTADNMEKVIEFPRYKVQHLHLDTLEHEILRPAGFEFELLKPKNHNGISVDTIVIYW
jgi:hypothetical protein